jgi:hypothetical protein
MEEIKKTPAEHVGELWEAMIVAMMKAMDIDHAAAEKLLRKKMREGLRLDE